MRGVKVIMQYHDEILTICKKDKVDEVKKHLEEAMIETNKQLKLNVTINISTEVGKNYAETH